MYTRLGTDIAQLKTAIAAEVTRGIASGHSWHDTAAGIARQGNVSAYNAMRIARTEGHRIACEAQMDGCRAAKEAGADVVKEWNAALDDRTREHHKLLNGQLRELDDAFEVDGIRVQYPGDFGRPEEDIHCRCALLQRARWALDKEELERLKDAPAAKELAETKDFAEFKGKYLEVSEQTENVGFISTGNSLTNSADSDIIIVEDWLKKYEPLTASEAVPVLRQESKQWEMLLTDEEKRSIAKYTKNDGDTPDGKFYQRLNAMLRGDLPSNPTLQYYSEVISEAISKNRLLSNVICYRTSSKEALGGLSVGDIYFPKQFLSTAVTPKGALNGDFKMMILTQNGANCAYIEALSQFPKQREMLFNFDCKYRILELNADSAVLEVIV